MEISENQKAILISTTHEVASNQALNGSILVALKEANINYFNLLFLHICFALQSRSHITGSKICIAASSQVNTKNLFRLRNLKSSTWKLTFFKHESTVELSESGSKIQ
ncbi:CLUMA_CG000916, isoform A [Clunio marinus]|uniref:CLUMA_CG000916, isoform A n=1 Tax=Clunio marinus TaxID=568069 RepID=A0A1J1HGC6_9DIPT|nr:CLUMA_CG000916, isoform A [Clunio marinus]